MASLNMVKVNALFRKGYLLAGVIMAANMFVMNEVKAMKENNKEKEKNTFPQVLDMASGFVLSRENTINLIGGTLFSVANNYLKWWDYNPGGYLNLRIGCLGWRSKRLLDIFQLDINLNLGRGAFWLIAGACNFFIKGICNEGKDSENYEDYLQPLHFSYLVAVCVEDLFNKEKDLLTIIALIGSFLLQGFVSAPLTFHLFNFSISISLDSIIWMGIGKFLELKVKENEGKEKKEKEEKTLKNIAQLNDQYQQNNGGKTFEKKGEGTELKDMNQNKNNNQNLKDDEENKEENSNNNEEQEEKDESIND